MKRRRPYSSRNSTTIQHIGELRKWRGTRPAGTQITDIIEKFAQDFRKIDRQLGNAVKAWDSVAPADIKERVGFRGMQRGELKLIVENQAVLYTVETALRSGLQRQLSRLCPAIRRVRVEVQPRSFQDPSTDQRRSRPANNDSNESS